MKTQIQYVKKKIRGGWIGMNKAASQENKVPYNHEHPNHTVVVYKKQPKHLRVNVIRHEECERYIMNNQHHRYKKAHQLALQFEKLKKPFPKKDIKRKLKQMGFKTR